MGLLKDAEDKRQTRAQRAEEAARDGERVTVARALENHGTAWQRRRAIAWRGFVAEQRNDLWPGYAPD